jgi:hypothetical protein
MGNGTKMIQRSTLTACAALLFATGVSATAQAQDAWKRLCLADETAYAGCVLKNGRMLAFCVPKGSKVQISRDPPEPPRVAFMTYRIAKSDGRIELVFPAQRAGSAARFRLLNPAVSKGGMFEISVRRGQYRYRYEDSLISRGHGKGHDETHGIAIYKNGAQLAFLHCREKAKTPSTPKVSFVIKPRQSFGPITRDTTLAGLRRSFGAANVRVGMYQPPHADLPKHRGALIYSGTPREVTVFFKERTNLPQWVIVTRKDSIWRTSAGIRIGTGLIKLERIFGLPFQVSSFNRDGGGSVIAGKDVPEAKQLILRLTWPENLSAADQKALGGGNPFSSDNPAARRAKLKVSVIWWEVRR